MIPIRTASYRMSSPRRRGEISLVVLHHTAGWWPGDLRTLRGLTNRKASSHWLVGREPARVVRGERRYGIVAIVPEERAAWHAGVARWSNAAGDPERYINDISLGIEISRPPPKKRVWTPYTDFQYEAVAQLCQYVLEKYPLIDMSRIVGHIDVAWPRGRKTDPYPGFNWRRLREMILGRPVKLLLDGEEMPDGRLLESTTYAPLRAVAEACGLRVEWDAGPPARVELRRQGGDDD